MEELQHVAEAFVEDIMSKLDHDKCSSFHMSPEDVHQRLEGLYLESGLAEHEGDGLADADYYELLHLIHKIHDGLLTDQKGVCYVKPITGTAHADVQWGVCHFCGEEGFYGYKQSVLGPDCYSMTVQLEDA